MVLLFERKVVVALLSLSLSFSLSLSLSSSSLSLFLSLSTHTEKTDPQRRGDPHTLPRHECLTVAAVYVISRLEVCAMLVMSSVFFFFVAGSRSFLCFRFRVYTRNSVASYSIHNSYRKRPLRSYHTFVCPGR